MFRELSAPLSVHWEVTPLCNERCVHCYNYWRTEENLEIPNDNYEIYEATTDEIINNKVFSVVITGGEPLLVIKKLAPYIERLAKAGVQLSLNSNVTLMSKDIAKQVKDLGITGILASFPTVEPQTNDEITQTKNSVQKISRGIRNVISAGLGITVNMVVVKKNLRHIYQTAKYVSELGVKNFSATAATIPGNCADFSEYALSREEAQIMFKQLVNVSKEIQISVDSLTALPFCLFDESLEASLFTRRTCGAGRTFVLIGFNGQVHPCPLDNTNFGDIRNGLKPAWQNMTQWRSEDFLPEECKTCNVKNRCRGACRVEALRNNGSYKASHPWRDLSNLPIAQKRQVLHTVNSNVFKVNPRLKSRQEEFGGILFTPTGSSIVPVNRVLYDMFTTSKEIIEIDYIANAFNCSFEEIQPTISHLVKNKVLFPIQGDPTCSE